MTSRQAFYHEDQCPRELVVRNIKPYVLNVVSQRASFSIRFFAWDDDSAIELTKSWARKARLADQSNFKIVRPDGSDLDVSEVVRPFLEIE